MTRAVSIEARASLAPQPLSVTEGTTELMNRGEVPISIPLVKDSDSIN
jgi:hypothetical protein